MSIFDDIDIEGEEETIEIDPIEIFNSLTLRGNIENLWTHQSTTLSKWHDQRSSENTLVKLNTGTGKTIIGLLMAQSIVNEQNGKVLYICPNNQLIEQTIEKCEELGINASSYYNGKWVNKDSFDKGIGPCITNYAAVFNGKSIFTKFEIDGLILDDSHVAYQVLRSCFTVSITDEKTKEAILELYRSYFENSSLKYKFNDIKQASSDSPLYIPLFASMEKSDELKGILNTAIGSDGGERVSNLFSYSHIRNHLDLCSIFISNKGVEIAPFNIPLSKFNFMSEQTKKIFLTATLPSDIEFTRSFGISDNINIIEPEGKLSDAQRLFLFPDSEKYEPEDFLDNFFDDYNICIISNSSSTAKKWTPEKVTELKKGDGQDVINAFSESEYAERLLLKARYDGIDLPGSACSVLALDGLPTGSTLYDAFFNQVIKVENIRKSLTSTKVIQSIGRIFRSNTDHGIVIIFGGKYQEWLKDPKNTSSLPELLQKQVKLSEQINSQVINSKSNLTELIDNFFNSTKDWDDFYTKNIKRFDIKQTKSNDTNLVNIYSREYKAFNELWNRNENLAEVYNQLASDCEKDDQGLSSWYRHIAGSLYVNNNDIDSGKPIINVSADFCSALGRLPVATKEESVFRTDIIPSRQASLILKNLKNKESVIEYLSNIANFLTYGKTKDLTDQSEAAVVKLGQLLGLDAKQVDNGVANTGPDTIWLNDNNEGASIELKTGKDTSSKYKKKDDIGQYFDHIQWLSDNYSDYKFYHSILGRKIPVVSEANPPADLRIITIDSFYELARRILNLYQIHNERSKPETIEAFISSNGLKWPICFTSMNYFLASDLKNEANFDDITELIG